MRCISERLRDIVALLPEGEIRKRMMPNPRHKPPRRRPEVQNKSNRPEYMREYMREYREEGKADPKVPETAKEYRREQRKKLLEKAKDPSAPL
jgi:hypothetical protein